MPAPENGAFSTPGVVEVCAATKAELDLALESAIAVVSKAAKEHGTGIMITRLATDRLVVRAHPAVPIGLVREQRP